MTPEEIFFFDNHGYLVVKNALNLEELTRLNAIADLHYPEVSSQVQFHGNSISQWGQDYVALIDHPRILPYLLELIDSSFRIDHDYCIFMRHGARGMDLHGGEGHEGDHWYKWRDGRMRNGLTVVTYALSDCKAGDGGFICIPGTHKGNYLQGIPREVVTQERRPDYVIQPPVAAGDAIIFTEALVHGTRAWSASYERRALLYKYSPGYSAWSSNYYSIEKYEGLTDQQRRIMSPPSVGGRPAVVAPSR